MAQVLTDADIDRIGAKPASGPLTDDQIAAHDQKNYAPPIAKPPNVFNMARDVMGNPIPAARETQADRDSADAMAKFREAHPIAHAILRSLGSDPTPMPSMGMNVPGSVVDPLVSGTAGALKGLAGGLVKGAHKLPIVGRTLRAVEAPFEGLVEGWKNAMPAAEEAASTAPPPAAAAPVAEAVPVNPQTEILDAMAQKWADKPFASLKPAQQEMIQNIAAKVRPINAPVPAQVPAAGPPASMPAPAEAGAIPPSVPASPVTATPQATIIPFSKETAPAEVFKAAARADRTPKVELMARHLNESGITPEQVDAIQPGKWRDIADSLKIDLPKALDSTIRDVKARMGELKSAKTTFEPSPALQEALKKPGAMEAARKLAEAMK